MHPNIAILGAGNMGSALIRGLIDHGHPPEKIMACGRSSEKLNLLREQFNISITTKPSLAVEKAEIIIFAVKPADLPALVEELSGDLREHQPLIISIVTGIGLESMEKWIAPGLPIVRCMPNTPALIGCAVSALIANAAASEKARQDAESIFACVGTTVWLSDEKQMDAVTALSGSGPAYFFLMMEALAEAGEKLGLPLEMARQLTLQTAYGSALLALEGEESLIEARKRVTSPGGTTAAGIRVLEAGKFRELIQQCVEAACLRAEELGGKG